VFVPLQVVAAVGAALKPANDDRALAKIDIVPAKVAGLGYPEAVTVDQQAYQPIPVAMPFALERREELVDLDLGQVLAHPVGNVSLPATTRLTGRITIVFGWLQRQNFRGHYWPLERGLVALSIEPTSVVGAGDSFLGAMIWALTSGRTLDEAFRYGVAAGSAALLVPGTELCRHEDIERLVKEVELDVLAGR
jgi:hypothetical protein